MGCWMSQQRLMITAHSYTCHCNASGTLFNFPFSTWEMWWLLSLCRWGNCTVTQVGYEQAGWPHSRESVLPLQGSGAQLAGHRTRYNTQPVSWVRCSSRLQITLHLEQMRPLAAPSTPPCCDSLQSTEGSTPTHTLRCPKAFLQGFSLLSVHSFSPIKLWWIFLNKSWGSDGYIWNKIVHTG